MTTPKKNLVKLTFRSSQLKYDVTIEPSIAAQIIAMLAQQGLSVSEWLRQKIQEKLSE